MKTVLNRIKSDIRQNRLALIILASYFLLTGLLFGQVCPLKLLCGLPCPGCGLVRGCTSFLMLHFSQSFYYNPTSVLWIFGILYLITCRYLLGKPVKGALPLFVIISLITVIIYVMRILTQFPGNGAMYYYPHNLLSTLLTTTNCQYNFFML